MPERVNSSIARLHDNVMHAACSGVEKVFRYPVLQERPSTGI